ncbi:hypothetical protein ABZY81_42870 [Streptomyces sp. NPDC006514]|uniref:hypothetical protein n=1 Tax=Streptomyces sp. NPDC006514 TaxID=3154308 RepID=UPI0033BA7A6E
MAGKRLTNPAGSWNDLRGDVLRVLGVLKVATADQIQRIASPHLTYRHTMKATASERKTARTASHAGALSDLRKHGLAENGGTTRAGESLRNLTTKGLEAASYELGRPLTEMGSTARGAGSSGATHPMAVNETVIAMLRPKPDLRLLTGEPAEAKAAAQAAVDAPAGVGTIASYATEVPLPATGTWGAPGKGTAQADIVLTAPRPDPAVVHRGRQLPRDRRGDRGKTAEVLQVLQATDQGHRRQGQADVAHPLDGPPRRARRGPAPARADRLQLASAPATPTAPPRGSRS